MCVIAKRCIQKIPILARYSRHGPFKRSLASNTRFSTWLTGLTPLPSRSAKTEQGLAPLHFVSFALGLMSLLIPWGIDFSIRTNAASGGPI
jgi:hypothetical protein